MFTFTSTTDFTDLHGWEELAPTAARAERVRSPAGGNWALVSVTIRVIRGSSELPLSAQPPKTSVSLLPFVFLRGYRLIPYGLRRLLKA